MTSKIKEAIEKMKKEFIPLDLVFAGGGAKGIVHIGALQELNAQGYTFRKLVGTSAGAITSTLLAVGYTPDEILDAITEKTPDGKARMSTFMDTPDKEGLESRIQEEKNNKKNQIKSNILGEKLSRSLLGTESYRQLVSFVYFGGFFMGKAFLEWMQEKLNKGDKQLGHATFAEFYEQTGIDLTVVATDTTAKVMLALNHRASPDVPVAWAVRMSMSIPFFWQEVVWKKEWGKYHGEDIHGHIVVDGGVISNFPLGLFLFILHLIHQI
jgi:predicted acylesterase/phospholipase RssA